MDAYSIAIWYASKIGFDTVIPAGEENNFLYFHIFNKSEAGKKLGIPVYVKISQDGEYFLVRDYDEVKRAIKRKVALMGKQ